MLGRCWHVQAVCRIDTSGCKRACVGAPSKIDWFVAVSRIPGHTKRKWYPLNQKYWLEFLFRERKTFKAQSCEGFPLLRLCMIHGFQVGILGPDYSFLCVLWYNDSRKDRSKNRQSNRRVPLLDSDSDSDFILDSSFLRQKSNPPEAWIDRRLNPNSHSFTSGNEDILESSMKKTVFFRYSNSQNVAILDLRWCNYLGLG